MDRAVDLVVAFAELVLLGGALWFVGAAIRNEETLMTGFRIVPWREWWRRFSAHGFKWRRYP
jgi:hypothetical protein